MGTIADKLAYTKQAREEITQAIIAKGVECPSTAPFCTFDEYISKISGGSANDKLMLLDDCVYYPEVWDASSVSLQKQSTNVVVEICPFNVRTSVASNLRGIHLPTTGLKSIMFNKPLPIGSYKKLCIEVTMLPYFSSGNNWAHTYLMLCSSTTMSNTYTPANLIKQEVVWTSAYGSNTDTPYYTKEVFEFDLTDISVDNVYLCVSHCDGYGKVNKIWLESDESSSNVNYKDIFNHGDVVGLNPLFTLISKNSQVDSWQVTSDKIYIPYTANANITLGYPMYVNNFSYLCFDAEATGKNGSYNYSNVGLRKVSNGFPTDYYASINMGVSLTNYNSQTNYSKTSPWYNLSRQIVKVPVNTISEPCMVSLCCCDCGVNIYSIWLE